VIDYEFRKMVLGMFRLGTGRQPRRANATRRLGGRRTGALKVPLNSGAPINTAMEKQSWYVVIYQQLRVFHKRTKLVCC